jgi:hypothetical protein
MEVIDPNWILLDTCSTVSVCCNPNLVQNIKPIANNDGMTIVTNGGSQYFNETADLKLLPMKVHFKEDSLANILSLSDVANLPGARITMDSEVEHAILLYYNDNVLKFRECRDGLYYFDTSFEQNNYYKPTITAYSDRVKPSLVQTVNSNKEFFTKSEIAKADAAPLLQSQIGWPSTQAFTKYVNNNLIINSGITGDDINRAQLIYGPPIPILKGKMKRIKPENKNITRMPLPPPVLQHHRNLQLYIDFFFVNKMPFLHTKSSKINFLTVQSGPNRTKGTIIAGIDSVISLYNARGFNISNVHGDNEFNIPALEASLRPTNLHIYGKHEHVGIVERSIQTIKERCRCMCNSVPFKR